MELRKLGPDRARDLVEGQRAVAEAELAVGTTGSERAEFEVAQAETEALGRALASRSQELWQVALRFVAHGRSAGRAENQRGQLAERLAGLGFSSRIPRYEVAQTLHAGVDTPKAQQPAGLVQTLTTDGLAALFPFADEAILEPHGVLVGLALADASPVYLDRYAHPSHSWGLFGTTGSGKTFAAALTLLRTLWQWPELDVVILDPLGEFGGLTRALGGELVRLADGGAGRLNPLDPATTGGDAREKAGRVAAMLRALYPSLTDEEAALLDATVTHLYRDGHLPSFRELATGIEGHGERGARLRRLLDVFLEGSLRFVDGATTLRSERRIVAFDFSGIPDDQLPFHLTYVLDWTYGRLRTRTGPKLILLDEAHLLARHDATAEFLDRLIRHLRHFQAGMLVLTQSPDDFLARPAGRALLRNLYAVGFLRLTEVSESARAFFGLGRAEAEWLPRARMPREAGYAESLWRVREGHLPLAIVASTPELEFLRSVLPAPGSGGAPDSAGSGGL